MSRLPARAVTVLTAALLPVLLTATPVLALNDGGDKGPEWSLGKVLLIYVVVPIALCLIIGALAWLPDALRANRYRPNRGWDAAPLWFGGPEDPLGAVQSAELAGTTRGGASGEF